MADFETIEGRRKGAVVYVCKGYLYLKNNVYLQKNNIPKTNVRCYNHNSGCSGTGYIEGEKFYEGSGHMHVEQFQLIEKLKIESKIKDQCEKTPLAPKDIYNENLKNNTEITPYSKLSSTMRKRRATTFPPVPKTMMGFHETLNGKELGKIQGEYFYRAFSTVSEEYALMFMAEIDHSILQNVDNAHIDATFKTVPNCFYQLLIVHCIILDTVVPCIFVLMTNKSRLLYDAVFLTIKNLVPSFKPKIVVTDFEKALFSSIKFSFGSDIRGCLFHYKQKVWTKWQQLGLSTCRDKRTSSWVKLIMSLPYLPENMIEQAFQELAPTVVFDQPSESILRFYIYVEKTWINGIKPFSMFSVYGQTRRTNSDVEVFHSAFAKRIGRKRPSFWFFLMKLKSVAYSYKIEVNCLNEGKIVRKYQSKLSKTADRYVSEAELKLSANRYRPDEFLKVVSHLSQKSLKKLAENNETIEMDENDECLDDTLEYFDTQECLEQDMTDYSKCVTCELEKIKFCAEPCGHMMCSFCIKDDKCAFCDTKIESKFPL